MATNNEHGKQVKLRNHVTACANSPKAGANLRARDRARRFSLPIVDPIAMFPELKTAHDAMFVGTLKIGRRHTVRVLSLEDASCQYLVLRDESGEGGSTWPDGLLTICDRIYRVSYNGKIWSNLEWKSGDVPAFTPSGAS